MKVYLEEVLREALISLSAEYPSLAGAEIQIEKPRSPEHGDAATNLALTLAGAMKMPPRKIAEKIVAALNTDDSLISSAEIAGPGFINFRFAHKWLQNQLLTITKASGEYGKTTDNKDKKVLIEFVSANPTGPLTVGHGRNAVLGDTIARLLEWSGALVDREYYFNNAGRQMRVLGESVLARYSELCGKATDFPDGGYEGDYIKDIASLLFDEHQNTLLNREDAVAICKGAAEAQIFEDIQNTLKRMNIRMDAFFNEYSLYESGAIESVVERLRDKNLAYDADGAVWFKTTEFGKEKDTVLIKSSGEPTYRLPDIAYHIHKLDRGYDIAIDIFGADHIATYPDVVSAVNALGYDGSKIDVQVYQFVTIVKDGKPFKMSTRKANFVTLDELMDEVGPDVTRFFFLMRSPGTHLEFDIAEAKEAGEKNPVFYLQYAHARICSILRKADETINSGDADADPSLLNHDSEINLIKHLLEFPDAVSVSARHREPHRLITYLNEAAAHFHKFYHDCRILGEEEKLASARVLLLHATANVLHNGLTILGIEAPDQM
ncbi:MAG: arginine--tRNA ligase [Balneolales bacterium]|nr:arginine--tRNA ligase [Balneolales bacterium]